MLTVHQFHYASDNLGYLIFGPKTAMAVDGGATEEILNFLKSHNLSLSIVTNTHNHPDHTGGNLRLINETGAIYFPAEKSAKKGKITIDGKGIKIHHTPGHSNDSVVFQVAGMLLTGDTLFNGTVGNCFSGDLKSFYTSIKTILAYPENTIIYAGHDYVKESMAIAAEYEPANAPIIADYLNRYNPRHVRSTLSDERRVNPYLRFNAPAMLALLKSRGLNVETEYDRWESLMKMD